MIFNSILLSAATPEVSGEMNNIKNLSLEDFTAKIAHSIVDFAIHLAIAILVFYTGKFIISRIYGIVTSILLRRNVDRSLSTFILSLVRMVLYFILIVTVIGILGINTSSFIALFASAGVAVGMALSGTLQNFAGGVLILLLKPYKVGDYIEAQGYAGTVTEIQIFHTIINTYDNKSIIIPNGGLSTGSINNWSREDYRRIDWTISISYGDSVDTARKSITDMLLADDRIVKTTLADDRRHRSEEEHHDVATDTNPLQDVPQERRSWIYRLFHRGHNRIRQRMESADINNTPNPLSATSMDVNRAPQVLLKQLNESSVDIVVRAWTRSVDYWNVYYEYNERFYNELPRHGISFPFPQMDIHLSHAATGS